jgi:NAD(P)-dependent dehydrogenase (short-subunit alcohol dehydrogenase family)
VLRGQSAIECRIFAPRACDVGEIALPVAFPGNSSPPGESFNRYLIQAFSALTGGLAEGFIQIARHLTNGVLHALIVGAAGTLCKPNFPGMNKKPRVHRNSGLHPSGRQTISCYIVLGKLRLHDMQVSHGTLIVTGASRGVGAAIATLAGEIGFSVAVNFSTGEPEARAIVEKIISAGGSACAIHADVSREGDIVRLFETAERELGPIKALVNNAAITGGFSRVDSVSARTLEQVMAVNVAGAILCAREAVRRMSTLHGGTGGAIVNISSRAARTGSAGEWVHYAASKGAIDSFTIGLAREVATEGIRVNAVAPGLIETGLHTANGAPDRLQRLASTIPMQRAGTPLEVAEGVLWLLSPAASYTTGAILEIGGGR